MFVTRLSDRRVSNYIDGGSMKINMGGKITAYSERYLLLVLYIVLAPVLILFSRLDPDAHHDGIMFTQALAVSEGLLPNKDVFAYYGPGSALIHGLIVHTFGNTYLVLRVFTSVVILLTAHLLYKFLNKAVKPLMSFGLVATWTLGLASNFPWSSTITTLLILSSSYLLVISSTKWRSETASIVIASSIIAFGTYVRIHLVVISIFVGLWFLLIERRSKVAKLWISSGLVTHFFVLALIVISKSMPGFVADSVIYPSSVRILSHYPISYIVGLLWYPALWLFFTLGAMSYRQLTSAGKFLALRYLFVAISGLFILSLVLYFYKLPRNGNVTYLNPRIILIDGSWMLLCGTGYAALVFVILMCFKVKRIRQHNFSGGKNGRVLIPIAIATAAQLYPLYDRLHLWYLAPVFIIAAILNFDLLKINIHEYAVGIAIILSILVSFQALAAVKHFSIERVSSNSLVFEGMLMSKTKQFQFDNSVKFIAKHAVYRNTTFDCANGFFAGATGRYLPNDSNFVNWGPKKHKALKSAKVLIVCKSTPEQVNDYLQNDWVLIGQQRWSTPDRKLPPLFNFAFKPTQIK